jgi:acyl-CoA synthetase (AMP-forming)/AMP-acid ligase II
VHEVVVFGEHDDVWGESVTAVVVRTPQAEVTAEELIAWCRTRIASFKKPKRLVFVDALPTSATGKVLRRELRATVTAGGPAAPSGVGTKVTDPAPAAS